MFGRSPPGSANNLDASVRVLLVPRSADLALDAGSLCTSLVQSIDSA